MGAVVAATTHAPISAIIVIFELTQDDQHHPGVDGQLRRQHARLAVASTASRSIPRSCRRQGIDLLAREDPNVLKSHYVRDAMNPEPEVIVPSTNFPALLDLVVQSAHSQFFVVDDSGRLLGAISLREVRRLIYDQDTLQHLVVASDLLDSQRPSLKEEDNLDTAMHLFASVGVDELAVVDAEDSTRLIGTLSEKDTVEVRNREWLRRDVAGGISDSVAVVEKGQAVDLGDGYFVREIATPNHLLGHSLREPRGAGAHRGPGTHASPTRTGRRFQSLGACSHGNRSPERGRFPRRSGSEEALERLESLWSRG